MERGKKGENFLLVACCSLHPALQSLTFQALSCRESVSEQGLLLWQRGLLVVLEVKGQGETCPEIFDPGGRKGGREGERGAYK